MKIVHVSDPHIVAPPATLYGLKPYERFRAALDHIAREHSDADLCVITGDLAHWGEPAAYDELSRILDRCPLPVALLLGNHDDRVAFRARFPSVPCDEAGFVQSSRELAGHTLLLLDTNGGRSHAGAYCEARLRWLDRSLQAARGDIFMFMHHPPFAVGISAMDAIALADADGFAECVRPHAARIRHLFLGHLHRLVAGSWLGIPFSVVRGTSHQVALDLRRQSREIVGSHEAPAYAVALVHGDRVVVHHCDFLDDSARFPLDADERGGRAYALGTGFGSS